MPDPSPPIEQPPARRRLSWVSWCVMALATLLLLYANLRLRSEAVGEMANYKSVHGWPLYYVIHSYPETPPYSDASDADAPATAQPETFSAWEFERYLWMPWRDVGRFTGDALSFDVGAAILLIGIAGLLTEILRRLQLSKVVWWLISLLGVGYLILQFIDRSHLQFYEDYGWPICCFNFFWEWNNDSPGLVLVDFHAGPTLLAGMLGLSLMIVGGVVAQYVVTKRKIYGIHLSTQCWIVLVSSLFILSNVMGDFSVDDADSLDHGWPLLYLQRQANPKFVSDIDDSSFFGGGLTDDFHAFWRDIREFYPWALLANTSLAMAITGLIAALWEWRRRVRPWWQFSLRRLFGVVTCCAVLVGIWSIRGRYEERLLDWARHTPTGGWEFHEQSLTPCFPTWLRHLVGDRFLNTLHWNKLVHLHFVDTSSYVDLDRLVQGLEIAPDHMVVQAHYRELDQGPRCVDVFLGQDSRVCHLQVFGNLHEDLLTRIGQTTSLETLKLSVGNANESKGANAERVSPWKTLDKDYWRGLSQLMELTIENCRLDEEMCRGLTELHNLHRLKVYRCEFPEGGLATLASLPKLTTLEIYECRANLRELSQFGNGAILEQLCIRDPVDNEETIVKLPSLPKLEYLTVEPKNLVSASDFTDRREYPKLKSINNNNWPFTPPTPAANTPPPANTNPDSDDSEK